MKRGRIPLGILSILIILLLNLLAASPSLHELLHADAGQPGHQCAVTVFAHGKVDSTTVEVAAVTPTVCLEVFQPGYISFISTSVNTLPPGRAPPVSFLQS